MLEIVSPDQLILPCFCLARIDFAALQAFLYNFSVYFSFFLFLGL